MLTDRQVNALEIESEAKGYLGHSGVELLIEEIRTLQQQNEQLDKSWSDGADELNKQLEWRNKRIEKLEQQNNQLLRYLERISVTFGEFECHRLAYEAIKSIQGGSSNDTGTN